MDEALYFDRDGSPIDQATHRALRRDPSYRVLAHDRAGQFEVVTSWLGTDQGPFADEVRPTIYGTFVCYRGGASTESWGNERFAATED